MTNKKILLVVSAIVLVFGLFLSGCATNETTAKGANFEKRPLKWERSGLPKYTVLGPVILEKTWFGIVGFSTPSIQIFSNFSVPGSDLYVYQNGGVTYVDILREAIRKYPNADAVVDINIDYTRSKYFFAFSHRTTIVAGIAIRYTREEVDYPPEKKGILDITK